VIALVCVARALAAEPAQEGPWLRAAISYAMVPESYHLRATAPDVPDGLSYTNPAFGGGLEIRGLAWIPTTDRPAGGAWGAELAWRGFSQLIEVEGIGGVGNDPADDSAYTNFATNFVIGARYRKEIQPGLEGYVGFGLHRIGTVLFRYTEDSSVGRPDLLRVPVTGERFTAGLLYARDDLYADVAIAQTLAILQPVDLGLSAAGEYQLAPAVAARIALGFDWRTIHFEVVDDDAHVRVIETAILLGVSYLRF
jgi:hypothetical protein